MLYVIISYFLLYVCVWNHFEYDDVQLNTAIIGGMVMIVIETNFDNKCLLDGFKEQFDSAEEYVVSALDGNDVVQILIPLSYIIAPLVAKTVQEIFANNKISVKFDGIEIKSMGYKNAMKMLKEVYALRALDKEDENDGEEDNGESEN